MAFSWHDVTIPMHPGMTVWPGDPSFKVQPLNRIENGDGCNMSLVSCCTHTGTHIDAPWHFEALGKRLEALDSALFFGNALLVDMSYTDLIHASHLGTNPLPRRLLIKTTASAKSVDAPFCSEYTALAPDAAQRIVDEGVGLVGIDTFGIGPYEQQDEKTHHILLCSDVIVVEGLRLGPFNAGTYAFTVLPMSLVGVDGAPCRAFIGSEEELMV